MLQSSGMKYCYVVSRYVISRYAFFVFPVIHPVVPMHFCSDFFSLMISSLLQLADHNIFILIFTNNLKSYFLIHADRIIFFLY